MKYPTLSKENATVIGAIIPVLAAILLSFHFHPPAHQDATTLPPSYSLCTPSPPDLTTEPGIDGHLSPLFKGLDVYHYPITTSVVEAQRYFDQGFILNYGFNHSEASRAFREVTRLDPECAMGYWGLAYVLGPNYNASMFPDVLGAAKDAVAKAQMYASKVSEKEQALIAAIAKRYPPNKEIDPTPYYEAYAESMKEAMDRFPDDLDIAAMTAEALMDLHPWDLWENDGTPKPWTPEIVDIIERVLAQKVDHPQAMHLYIHAMEASGEPQKALLAAHGLRHRVPGAGHLVHMPSHLYIRTGLYHDGTLANERAVFIDSIYMKSCQDVGVYSLGLVPHNWHFLAACAALEGDGEKALAASQTMVATAVDTQMMKNPEWATLQHYYSIPWFIMVKFGMWDRILNEPMPDPGLIYPSAILAYARAMAYVYTGQDSLATIELSVLSAATRDQRIENYTIWEINTLSDILMIAEHMVSAHLAIGQQNFAEAENYYLQAIAIEDALAYNEPPDWFFSIRHYYGDLLLQTDQHQKAIDIYQEDLREYPDNGFALHGLMQAYEGMGDTKSTLDASQRFNVAWQWSPFELESSLVTSHARSVLEIK